MTLRKWLDSKENTFVECVVIDADRNSQYSWLEDDPKYKANVVRVLSDDKGNFATVVTDYKEVNE